MLRSDARHPLSERPAIRAVEPRMPLAGPIEAALATHDGLVTDDRDVPLFELGERLRDGDLGAFWNARVVDTELLAQGAPAEVILHAVAFSDALGPALVARALEATIIDHPRIQLCHSAAMPQALLAQVQPDEPSALLPPLHVLPLCDEVPCIVLVKESSDGIPLLTWRQQRGAELKRNEILDLLDTVAEALAALHRRGFAHGALTPDSIVLQEIGLPQLPGEPAETVWVPKLVDVGLSRTLAAPGAWPSGSSALWCAPEAFAPDLHTDWRRVDQLALAGLLYALLTDQVPFDVLPAGTPPADARDERRRQIEALPPPRGNARARALGVTPAMSAACLRALSANPADRFPSVETFSAALRAAVREAGRREAGRDEPTDPAQTTTPGTQVTSKFRTLSQQAKIAPNPARSAPLADSSNPLPTFAPMPGPGDFTPLPTTAMEALLRKGDARRVKVNPLAPPVDPTELPERPVPDFSGEPGPLDFTPLPSSAAEALLRKGDQRRVRPNPLASPDPELTPGREPLAAAARSEDTEPRTPLPRPDPRAAEPDETDRHAIAEATANPWALNHLATVLLVLWLATIAFALLRTRIEPDAGRELARERAPASAPAGAAGATSP